MSDCHHRECCGCERPATVVAEAIGTDGMTTFTLCEPHLRLLVEEARRKRLPIIATSPLDGDDE